MGSLLTSLRQRVAGAPSTATSAPTPTSGQIVFDEELLARLRRLTLLSTRSVSQGLAGEHRSQRRGSSPEFADFKSYSQGDDFRRIDWNIYSRLGEVFVRLSEVTTELTVHLLLDASGSMDWSRRSGACDQVHLRAQGGRLAGLCRALALRPAHHCALQRSARPAIRSVAWPLEHLSDAQVPDRSGSKWLHLVR